MIVPLVVLAIGRRPRGLLELPGRAPGPTSSAHSPSLLLSYEVASVAWASEANPGRLRRRWNWPTHARPSGLEHSGHTL